MRADSRIPAGFTAVREGRGTLIALDSCVEELRAAGLSRPEGWQERLEGAGGGAGRGGSAVFDLPSGVRARLKPMRRGGWIAPVWRDCFIGTGRLLANLATPVEAVRRGIRTPTPLALLILEERPLLYRGWLALEDFPDAVDLATRFARENPPSLRELGAVMAAVRRMHDLGLEHRDLNLGNLLLRQGDGEPQAFVIDLDRARLHPGTLRFRSRQRALRRIERSHVKSRRATTPLGEVRDLYYALYAAGDERLGERLDRGRRAARFWIRVHGVGWRS